MTQSFGKYFRCNFQITVKQQLLISVRLTELFWITGQLASLNYLYISPCDQGLSVGDSNMIYNTFCTKQHENQNYERKRSAQNKLQNNLLMAQSRQFQVKYNILWIF